MRCDSEERTKENKNEEEQDKGNEKWLGRSKSIRPLGLQARLESARRLRRSLRGNTAIHTNQPPADHEHRLLACRCRWDILPRERRGYFFSTRLRPMQSLVGLSPSPSTLYNKVPESRFSMIGLPYLSLTKPFLVNPNLRPDRQLVTGNDRAADGEARASMSQCTGRGSTCTNLHVLEVTTLQL